MAGTEPDLARSASRDSAVGGILAANRLVLLGAVPLFLVLAVVVYITVQFAANERDAQALVRHTYEVGQQLEMVLGDMRDAETGQRGFLLTRQQNFLEPYQAARARVSSDVARFTDLTRDNPHQQQRARDLARLVRERFEAFDATLKMASGAVSPELTAALQSGKAKMDGLRAETTAGMAEEQGLLAQRDTARREQERFEITAAISAGLLTLGILLIAAALLVRYNLSLAKAERDRANEAAILQATLDNAREGIAYFASTGLLCTSNAHFFRLLNLPESMANRSTHLPDLRAVHEGLRDILKPFVAGDAAHDLKRISWADRELEIYSAPVSTGGFLMGVMDVTARVRAESMVRQSQKMEAIGHLTGGVAHDFNNLLQIISANLDLAVSSGEAKGSAKLSQRLQNAIGAVSRGSRLTGQLLAFARRQALDPRSLDMGRVIRDMADLLRRTLGERIEVESVIAGGLWNTLVDPNQLENAILNLAINARDAMSNSGDASGKLTLEVANAYLDDAYARQHVEVTPGQYVMLAISDTGSGMTPEVLSRVFEPFFTTKPEGKGTGLGLAQAYGFVKQSGGHIKIYSEVGEGTTVKMYLPRTRREQDAADPMAGSFSEGGTETILVVEDDEGVRAAAVDMLTDLGYTVLRAENAEAALKILQGGAKIQLLFTDVVMPGPISTREFTRRAVEMLPGLLVLYTSGYTQNAIVHNGRLDDDAFLLSKPYRKDELARKLRSIFAGTARGPLASSSAAAAVTPDAARAKVLVVEDVMLIRMATVDMIEQIGFTAAEAGDGAEALAILQKDPEISILLTDLGLPGMNGRQLVEEARRLRPDLKVIIASGYSSENDAGGKPTLDVTYLTKPFDLGQVRRALGV